MPKIESGDDVENGQLASNTSVTGSSNTERELTLGGPPASSSDNLYRNVELLRVLQGTVGAVEIAAGGAVCAVSRGLICSITIASGVRNLVEVVTGIDIATSPLVAVGVPQSGANAAGVMVDMAQIAAFPAVVVNGVFFRGWPVSGVVLNSLLTLGGASGIPSAVTRIPDPTDAIKLYENP